ncbi:hypothetical protein L218DRAFT_1010561 [Marasmius fiardii PR-910]|nr:hypothetical protein L218DRAFT_1010561 [Marasmius fiardii PR-910]
MGSLLWEECYTKDPPNSSLVEVYQQTQGCAEALLEWLDSQITVVAVDTESKLQPGIDVDVVSVEIHDDYMAQQCLALHSTLSLPAEYTTSKFIMGKSFFNFLLADFAHRLPSIISKMKKFQAEIHEVTSSEWQHSFSPQLEWQIYGKNSLQYVSVAEGFDPIWIVWQEILALKEVENHQAGLNMLQEARTNGEFLYCPEKQRLSSNLSSPVSKHPKLGGNVTNGTTSPATSLVLTLADDGEASNVMLPP